MFAGQCCKSHEKLIERKAPDNSNTRTLRYLPASIVVLLIVAAEVIGGRMLCGAVATTRPSDPFAGKIKPLVADYCGRCHGDEKQKGDLNLTRFDSISKVTAEKSVWATVAERIEAGEMPPGKSKQLSSADRDALLNWVHSIVDEKLDPNHLTQDQLRTYLGGHVEGRRLSRTEYSNTIRDLIGLDVNPAEAIPADGSGGEGFDNDGDTLFVTDMLVEKYLDAARKVADAVMSDTLIRRRLGFEDSTRAPFRASLAAFARRAFRRPVDQAEIDRLMSPYDNAVSRGESSAAAAKLSLEAILISPHFLFLSDPQPRSGGLYRIDDYTLASRLSYFLWSTMPDETLFQLAAQNRLHEPQVLRQQLRRMIADRKSFALAENFTTQWLSLDELGYTITPGRLRFPEWNRELGQDEVREPILLLNNILREDRSLLELIDCSYTFANERLAKLYGIMGVSGNEMRRVTLKPDAHRGGLLTMAAVLTTTSFPIRTSPVLRGKWVMGKLLGTKVPPPPPTTPLLPKSDKVVNGKTFRQQLEVHRADPQCASCHKVMDQLGFGLDNFDAIGRWRTQIDGKPIDSSGVLPDGTKFNGPEELKRTMLKNKDQFLRTLARKMMGYALGRGVNPLDQTTVDDAVTAMKKDGFKPSTLIETIVMSRSFQYRYAEK